MTTTRNMLCLLQLTILQSKSISRTAEFVSGLPKIKHFQNFESAKTQIKKFLIAYTILDMGRTILLKVKVFILLIKAWTKKTNKKLHNPLQVQAVPRVVNIILSASQHISESGLKILQFWGTLPTGAMKKILLIPFVRKAWSSYLKITINKVGEPFGK